MTPSPKNPSAAFWSTLALVAVLVGYPLCFGPACWAMDPLGISSDLVAAIYRPILWLVVHGPAPVSGLMLDYANCYTRDYFWGVDPVALEFIKYLRPLF